MSWSMAHLHGLLEPGELHALRETASGQGFTTVTKQVDLQRLKVGLLEGGGGGLSRSC